MIDHDTMSSLGRKGWAALLGVACAMWAAVAGDNAPPAGTWDLASDTWVATDALGRSVPVHPQAGPPRVGKSIGLFYFLWLGRHGEHGPFDISKILAQDPQAMEKPDSPLWGPLYDPHHWGESIFGYYVGDDDGVLRKHAQMLGDAGVDAIIFDVTNQLTYPESWRALCRVFDEMRRLGNRVPQIAFLCPFGDPPKVVRELYKDLYEPGLYPELWYRWEGKPLIMADPDAILANEANTQRDHPAEVAAGHSLGQSFTTEKPLLSVAGNFPTWGTTNGSVTLRLRRGGPGGELVSSNRFEAVLDNSWLALHFDTPLPPGRYYMEAEAAQGRIGWWSHQSDVFPRGEAFADGQAVLGDRNLRLATADETGAAILKFFTFRKPQPDYFVGPRGPREWGWLEVYPQHAFYVKPGVAEQATVGVAQNAVDGKLGVLSNPRSHGRSFHDGREPEPAQQDATGRNFAEQWRRAFELDPAFVFVTGWNEWIAGRFPASAPFHGAGPVSFVDQFDPEHSRDIEPMKGGHGDNYYYQFVSEVRRFKGVRPLEPVRSHAIAIDGRFDDWKTVGPEFRDTIGDPMKRDYRGWGKEQHYVNRSGRNDLVAAKVSRQAGRVAFYARTREAIVGEGTPHWMLLYVDTDANPATGWLGYDVVINRRPPANGRASVERHEGNGYAWTAAGDVELKVAGSELEVAVPENLLRLPAGQCALDFKWADNIQETGEASDFTLNGDVAPNDRFNYRALFCDEKVATGVTPTEHAVRLGLIADPQYSEKPSQGGRFYKEAPARLSEAVQRFNQEQVDFVVNLGDLIDGNGAQSREDLAKVLSVLGKAKTPVRHVVGNHCLEVEPTALFSDLGLSSPYYDFEAGGWRFVVLYTMDVSVKAPAGSPERAEAQKRLAANPRLPQYNGAVGAKQLAWLRERLGLARAAGQRVILFSHHPLLAAASNASLTPWNAEEIVKALEESGVVAACFAGHDHRGGYAWRNGIHYLTLPGMVEAPAGSNAYAILLTGKECLEVQGFGTVTNRTLVLQPQPVGR